MEVASAVYSLANTIITFIAAHDDKQALTHEVSSLVKLIQSAIKPLFLNPHSLEKNESVKECLCALQGVLHDIYYHLRLWKESRSHRLIAFVRPGTVNQQLQQDRQTLMYHYSILAGSTGFVDHVNAVNVVRSNSAPPSTAPSTAPSASNSTTSLDAPPPALPEPLPFIIGPKPEPENREVSYFWEHCVGSKVSVVSVAETIAEVGRQTELESVENFCVDISAHLAFELSPVERKRLLFRLDEKNTGYISYSALQGLVKEDQMADAIKSYSQDPQLPLLVWIDDNIPGNEPKVLDAIRLGVTVIQLPSTRAAKAWIQINFDFLKAHDNAGEIRYMSDQVRVEASKHDVVFENHDAGTEMLKYIREQGLQAPVLIYTDRKSIFLTHYVEKDKNAGSLTSHYKVFRDYVAALGAGRKDDTGWKKFDA